MPEKDFYLLIILSVITGFLLIQIVMPGLAGVETAAVYNEESQSTLHQRAAAKE